MQLLRDVAQQARRAAMQPGQITQRWAEQHADKMAFDAAVAWATNARLLRARKREGTGIFSPGRVEALAREAETHVREIALQSEIILQRRAEAADADRAMLGIMLGVAS
jgi:hypothetical protein